MYINFTYFIQIINFGITYFFLKRLIFAPLVQKINDKETEESILKNSIKEKNSILLLLQEKKKNLIKQYQIDSKKFYTFEAKQDYKIPEIAAYKQDNSLQLQLIQQTKEYLIKRVPNVF